MRLQAELIKLEWQYNGICDRDDNASDERSEYTRSFYKVLKSTSTQHELLNEINKKLNEYSMAVFRDFGTGLSILR